MVLRLGFLYLSSGFLFGKKVFLVRSTKLTNFQIDCLSLFCNGYASTFTFAKVLHFRQPITCVAETSCSIFVYLRTVTKWKCYCMCNNPISITSNISSFLGFSCCSCSIVMKSLLMSRKTSNFTTLWNGHIAKKHLWNYHLY